MTQVLKFLIFSFFILESTLCLGDCGSFKAAALVVSKEGLLSLVINPKTKSEINLKIELTKQPKLAPYVDRTIELDLKIMEEMDFTLGSVASFDNIKPILPDFLSPSKGTYLKLVKKEECNN